MEFDGVIQDRPPRRKRQPARAHQIARAANGRDPGNEKGRD